ncbi:MAG: hypothetical protein KF908_10490 [Nitrosomonas sp.]|uniref:Uncharacterized protein n=1 Tax=Nitrosomonas aestuarii TaxID=52441 RepID=A0A1I4DJS9_9PROT|nr:hypothetical protein [Nitrosomonas aestuarii]MBX3630311.1 hypothetical protein [Nitrosomonas sp.]SFK93373.1 hypothetical protein SAMN05216302_102172 [Nitrosomonas aestuarii]
MIVSSGSVPYDDEIEPFALGVTLSGKLTGTALPNLPGAPIAFVTDKPSVISDAQAIAEFCEKTGCFSSDAINSIREFYSREEKGRSIISWPIKDAKGARIAVINIYRNKKDIALDEKRANRLVGILQPFTLMIRDLLADMN